MLRGLLTDPDSFFEQKVSQAGIRLEVGVVVLVGAASVPGVAFVLLEILAVEDTSQMEIAAYGQALRPLLVAIVFWVGYTVALHFLSSVYRGRGPPGPVLKGTAWALIPVGLGNALQSAALYVAFADADIESRLTGIEASGRLQAVFDSGMPDPVVIVSTVVFAGTLVWSAHLMSYVVAHAKDIDVAEGRKVVAVPLCLHLITVAVAIVEETANFGLVL